MKTEIKELLCVCVLLVSALILTISIPLFTTRPEGYILLLLPLTIVIMTLYSVKMSANEEE